MFIQRGRWTRTVIAVGMLLYGVLMLIAPANIYTAPGYKVLFSLAAHIGPPYRVWGTVWVATGLAGLFWRNGGALVMICTMWVWSLGLWNAVWAVNAGTWGGPIWPTLIAILLSMNIGRERFR